MKDRTCSRKVKKKKTRGNPGYQVKKYIQEDIEKMKVFINLIPRYKSYLRRSCNPN